MQPEVTVWIQHPLPTLSGTKTPSRPSNTPNSNESRSEKVGTAFDFMQDLTVPPGPRGGRSSRKREPSCGTVTSWMGGPRDNTGEQGSSRHTEVYVIGDAFTISYSGSVHFVVIVDETLLHIMARYISAKGGNIYRVSGCCPPLWVPNFNVMSTRVYWPTSPRILVCSTFP